MIILATTLVLMCVTVSGTTNGSETYCIPLIKVPRNTVFIAPVTTELKINCTVSLHGCHRSPRVSWCKLYGNDCKALNYSVQIRPEWKNITEHNWMAFLIFLNISMEDAGLYRCKEGDTTVSHAINVTVTVDKEDKVLHNQSNSGDLNSGAKDDMQWLWPYVYICCGVAGPVVMTVSSLYIIRSQRRKSARKDMANKNQYKKTEKKYLLLHPDLYLNSDVLTSVVYRV